MHNIFEMRHEQQKSGSGYLDVADALLGDIRSGRYAADRPFPSLTAIMRRFGVSRVTASRATRIVKNGAGAFSYAGDAALDVDALTVSAGEFRLSGPRGTTNRWWRFTLKQCADATAKANLSGLRLLDGVLTAEGKYSPADGAAPDPDYPNGSRGSYSRNTGDPSTYNRYNWNYTYQQGRGTPTYTTAWTARESGQTLEPNVIWVADPTTLACEFTNPYPKQTDPNTWIVYTYRIPEGRPIRGYNLRQAWGFSNYPKYWLLESSANGVTWETMDSQSNYALTASGQSWYNNGGHQRRHILRIETRMAKRRRGGADASDARPDTPPARPRRLHPRAGLPCARHPFPRWRAGRGSARLGSDGRRPCDFPPDARGQSGDVHVRHRIPADGVALRGQRPGVPSPRRPFHGLRVGR